MRSSLQLGLTSEHNCCNLVLGAIVLGASYPLLCQGLDFNASIRGAEVEPLAGSDAPTPLLNQSLWADSALSARA